VAVLSHCSGRGRIACRVHHLPEVDTFSRVTPARLQGAFGWPLLGGRQWDGEFHELGGGLLG
jgi:hypothetical protein